MEISASHLKIHKALHDPNRRQTLEVNGVWYKVHVHPNGCRYIDFQGTRIIQQNPARDSTYAQRARQGEALSWIMCKNLPWTLIEVQLDTD